LQLTAQTGIGTTTPHASAKLEVAATNKGFLPPRMTSSQRDAIPSPAAGLMVYQTDGVAGFYVNTGSSGSPSWMRVNTDWTKSGNDISFSGGDVSITGNQTVNGNVTATNFIGTASTALTAPTNISYGEIDVPQALAVATGFVDLASIPLPNAGTYKITYVVRASVTTNGTLSVLLLRNGSNTQISGTEAMAIYNSSNVQVTCTQVCIVTPTAAETFKLSVWTQAGAGNFNAINDGNGRSKVLWEKIK
jgi:hypothetical protein